MIRYKLRLLHHSQKTLNKSRIFFCEHINTVYYVMFRRFSSDLMSFMHGRKNKERRDSVTGTILKERKRHQERIKTVDVNDSVVENLISQGLGRKKKLINFYMSFINDKCVIIDESIDTKKYNAGGFASQLGSASKTWPIFKHLLPEIAFAGHSNAGKSTLVNAMCGVQPRKGPAGISDRAGWTDQICFYQLGKMPPVLTLADLPGYGHAVASAAVKRQWKDMMEDYLTSRPILSRCCVLVDCTRGLCGHDKRFIRFLLKHKIEWMVVLTKADLLDPIALAQSMKIVELDLEKLIQSEPGIAHYNVLIKPVSSATGAGITELWVNLSECSYASTRQGQRNEAPPNSRVVLEHINAGIIRSKKRLNDTKVKRLERTKIASKDGVEVVRF